MWNRLHSGHFDPKSLIKLRNALDGLEAADEQLFSEIRKHKTFFDVFLRLMRELANSGAIEGLDELRRRMDAMDKSLSIGESISVFVQKAFDEQNKDCNLKKMKCLVGTSAKVSRVATMLEKHRRARQYSEKGSNSTDGSSGHLNHQYHYYASSPPPRTYVDFELEWERNERSATGSSSSNEPINDGRQQETKHAVYGNRSDEDGYNVSGSDNSRDDGGGGGGSGSGYD